MEFNELLVTTKVDALVRLVKEKGTIELGIAAKFLDVEPINVEEWAHILEEEGLVKIEYHLTKSYISWVPPTPEQVAEEQKSFYVEKGEVLQELKDLREQMAPKEKELKELNVDFRKMYDKFMPSINKLQAQLNAVSSLKKGGVDKLSGNLDKLDSMEKRMEDLSESIAKLKGDLGELKTKIKEKAPAETKFKDVSSIKEALSDLGDRLKVVDEKISLVQKSIPKEKLDKDALQKSLDPLKREFADFKKSNSIMRENLLSIKEAFEILGDVDESVEKRAKRIDALRAEMQGLLSSLKELQAKGNLLAENMKAEIGTVEGFSDSIQFVKTAFSKFPSQKEVLAQVDEISSKEKSLEVKISALEKNLSTETVPQLSLDELSKLKAELDEKRKLLSQEVSELFSAVEQESATYSTFQKIKERANLSFEEYSATIKKLESEIKAMTVEITKVRDNVDSELDKVKGKVDDKVLQEVLKGAEQIEQKHALLDEVAESLEALTTASDGIARKINLLSKEAEMLALRTEGVSSPVQVVKEGELRQQLSLTKNEQADFERKREELRDLIKKLWEQS